MTRWANQKASQFSFRTKLKNWNMEPTSRYSTSYIFQLSSTCPRLCFTGHCSWQILLYACLIVGPSLIVSRFFKFRGILFYYGCWNRIPVCGIGRCMFAKFYPGPRCAISWRIDRILRVTQLLFLSWSRISTTKFAVSFRRAVINCGELFPEFYGTPTITRSPKFYNI